MVKQNTASQSNRILEVYDCSGSVYDTTVYSNPGATISRLTPIQASFSLDCETPQGVPKDPWFSSIAQDTWTAVATTEQVAASTWNQSVSGISRMAMNSQAARSHQPDTVSSMVQSIRDAAKTRKEAPKGIKYSEVSERAQVLLDTVTAFTVETELRQPEPRRERHEQHDDRREEASSMKLEPEETAVIQKEKKELAAKKRAERAKKKGAAKTDTNTTRRKNGNTKTNTREGKGTVGISTNSPSTNSPSHNNTTSIPISTTSAAPKSAMSTAPKSTRSMAPKSTPSLGPKSTTSRSAKTSLSMIARTSESEASRYRSSNSTIATKASIAKTTASGPRARKGREPPGFRADPPGAPVGGYNDDATQAPPREGPLDDRNDRIRRQAKSIVRTDLQDAKARSVPWSVTLMLPPQLPGCTVGVQRAATPPPMRPCDLPRGDDINKKQKGSIFGGAAGEFISKAIKPFGL